MYIIVGCCKCFFESRPLHIGEHSSKLLYVFYNK
jgi:hypothetical protein